MTGRFLCILVSAVLCAGPLAAQDVASASGAVLRVLDKTSGDAKDLEVLRGQMVREGRLQIAMQDCRYPAGNPSGNAYAALEITEVDKDGVLFSGWMIASSPALSALEHQRYDVWVIRCITS